MTRLAAKWQLLWMLEVHARVAEALMFNEELPDDIRGIALLKLLEIGDISRSLMGNEPVFWLSQANNNWVLFCANNPVNMVDPDGLEAYYVLSGGGHASIIVSDPRSKTKYTEYSFVPTSGGWGRGLPLLERLAQQFDALHCPGEMQKLASFPTPGGIKLETTPEEECAIRKEGDQLHSDPGWYNAPFRNCATVARDILADSGFLGAYPNTLGGVYTPNSVADDVRGRNERRLRNLRLKKALGL